MLEEVFDLALTPNIETHYVFSNWLKKGQGSKILAEMYAQHCESELGEYHIEREVFIDLPEQYMTVHTTSGKGQWEGRYYRSYQEVVDNIKQLYPDLKVVQVGAEDEPALNVDVDLRGKTNYQQLAFVVEGSSLHLCPDTFSAHIAAAVDTPFVALYGCSSARHTRPWVKDLNASKFFLLQSERLTGCKERPCYKNKCKKSDDPAGPMNEIQEKSIFDACARLLKDYENVEA